MIGVYRSDRLWDEESHSTNNTIHPPPYRLVFLLLWAGLTVLLAIAAVISNVQDAQARRGSIVFDSEQPKAPIQTQRAYNIAHRGANGQLPEETAEAYQVGLFPLGFISVVK
jgi:hypothetical protein